MTTKGRVLVIGAAHLDILARPELGDEEGGSIEEKERRDKIGSVEYAVGGCGYNIAANLAGNVSNVELFTCLRKNSLITGVLLRSMEDVGIDTRYVSSVDRIPESGFVAHTREDGDVMNAVSCAGISYAPLNEDDLRSATNSADVIVAETNLTATQLRLVISFAKEARSKLLLHIASDSKIDRLLDVVGDDESQGNLFENITMNGQTFSQVQKRLAPDADVCAALHTRAVVVTQSKDSYCLYFQGASDREDVPLDAPPRASILGLEEAVVAGIAQHLVEDDNNDDWLRRKAIIAGFATSVMQAKGATPDSDKIVKEAEQELAEPITLGMLMALALALTGVGTLWRDAPLWVFGVAFFATPLFAGCAGGVLRMRLQRVHENPASYDGGIVEGAVLGAIAGVLSALLFVLAQLASTRHFDNVREAVSTGGLPYLIPFSLVIGFVGGLTLEEVYGKLKRRGVQILPNA